MKTRAAILHQTGADLIVDEVEIPGLGYGQALVRILTTRICGSQIGEIDAVKGPDRYLPHLIGHEATVEILELGPGIKHLKTGDRAVAHWRPGEGVDAGGTRYRWKGADCNAGPITTFQEIAVISANRLTRVPPDTDPELGALLADTLTTGFGVIHHEARVKIGDAVVIIGCGGIGSGAVLGAVLAGAHPVIAVDLHDSKLALAKKLGATETFSARDPAWAEKVRAFLGHPADVVIDGTGQPAVLEQAYELCGSKGRCIGIGVMRHDQKLSINTLPLHLGRVLTGSEGGSSQPHREISKYLRILADRKISTKDWITHRCTLAEINQGIRWMRSGEPIHVMVRPA